MGENDEFLVLSFSVGYVCSICGSCESGWLRTLDLVCCCRIVAAQASTILRVYTERRGRCRLGLV